MDIAHIIGVSLLSVAALFAITKLMGHKQLAQLDFFDYISGITIGSIAAELAAESDEPLRPLIALVIYGFASIGLSLLTHKLPRSRKYINGSPTVLLHNGKLLRTALKKAKLDLSEFLVMCREQGYFDLNDIQTAVLEHNGKLSILPVSTSRPLTPADLRLQPEVACIQVEVIMDGRVLDGNLQKMGLDPTWLNKQLKAHGYKTAKDIFLGLCDASHRLTLFAMER